MAESGVNNSSSDAATGRLEQTLCQPCSRKDIKTTAEVFCSDCDEFQCSECSNAHTLYMFMKNHKFVNASEVKSKEASFESQRKEICDKHNKLLKFFCEDENKICCSSCVIVYHRKCHSIVEAQKYACKSHSAGSNLKRKWEEINAKTSIYTLPGGQKCVAPVDSIVELTEIISIDLIQTWDDVKEPLYTGLDFLPDGRLIAVDNQNKKCLIYNEKLEKVGSYQLSYWPQGVVAVSEEQVAITSGGTKIDFLRVSTSNEITLNRICKVTAQYDSICMKDERNFVVGTFNDMRPVRIVSLSGEESDFNISFSTKKTSLRTSACNYIKDTAKLILTDMYEHTVYIYDTETNRRVAVKDDQIKEPGGVAVGPLDCILVCSENTNSIVQISQTGRVLSSYKLNMKYPRRVCVSKDKSILAVTNCCNTDRKLQLYKLTCSM